MLSLTDARIVLRDMGVVLMIIGITFLMPTFVVLYYGESDLLFKVFLYTGLACSVGGFSIYRVFYSEEPPSAGHSFIVATLSWLIAPLLGAIPYYTCKSCYPTMLDALFESVSGITTTGLTVAVDVEKLPRTLLFWRSFQQYIGGAGFILMSLIFLRPIFGAFSLYLAEGRAERIRPTLRGTAIRILQIYLFYLALATLAYRYLGGMPYFDAICHAMTSLSTGGMSTKNASIIAFGYRAVIISTIFMFVGALNFSLHNAILSRRWREFFRDIEVRTFFLVIAIFSLVIFLDPAQNFSSLKDYIIRGFYHAESALTTTGYGTADISSFSELSLFALTILMVIGGSTGSTAGGIKLERVGIALKTVYWQVQRLVLPGEAVFPKKIHHLEDLELSDEEILSVLSYIAVYLILLVASAVAISLYGYHFRHAIFEAASALGTVGLSVGITSATAPPLVKSVLLIDMLLGRLEIWPIFATILTIFSPRKFVL